MATPPEELTSLYDSIFDKFNREQRSIASKRSIAIEGKRLKAEVDREQRSKADRRRETEIEGRSSRSKEIAPEYGMGREVSTYGDVYSYGILLLEMFTGKRPTNSMFNHTLSIPNFAKVVLPEQVLSIADPSLLHRIVEGEASSRTNNAQNHSSTTGSSHKIQECLISILNVGIACSEELPRDRMAINDVTQLHVIKKTLIGSGGVHGGRRDRIAMQS